MLLTFRKRNDAAEDPLLQQRLTLETEVQGLERVCIFEVRRAWCADGRRLYQAVRSETLKGLSRIGASSHESR